MTGYHWITRPDVAEAWFLVDGAGTGVRQVKCHVYLGQAEPYFMVTGSAYEATQHPSLEEAKAAAEASLA